MSTNLPSHARAVIIGGGIMGCGLAYHLAHEGWQDIVLLEKGELTSGSTWHAAGQITQSISSYSLGHCVSYGIDLYQRLQQETGQSVTWHGCGSLRMAYTDEEVDWLYHILSVGRALSFSMHLLTPGEVKKLHPFYNMDGIKLALYTPDDGHADPSGITQAYAKGARQLGATIVRQCRVTVIESERDNQWKVITPQGAITCEHVVNAAGTYARQIAKWQNYDLPAIAMTHHYFVTEPVDEFKILEKELPVVRDDRFVSGYIRMEQKSGLIGIYEKENTHSVWEEATPWESEHELFDPHYERVMPWLENALQRVPIFANYGIRRVVHGAITHPPDGHPLIGPAPKLRNYWCCGGCQIGIGWGAGLTRELARWMVHGAADISMREFDPRRFGDYADFDYQLKKAHEDYSLRHEIPYPHLNRLLARPVKTSPLYEAIKEKNAVFEEVYGWERPRWFAPSGTPAKDQYGFKRTGVFNIVGKEVNAVRYAVGVIDISAFAKIIVEGDDALNFLNRLTTNRIPQDIGDIVLSYFLSQSGRIETDATITRLGKDCFYIVCASFFEQKLIDHLTHHRFADESVIISNYSKQWAAIGINGPKSRDLINAVSCVDGKWLKCQSIQIEEQKLWALRLSYAGELGWEIHGENSTIRTFYQALQKVSNHYQLTDYGSFAMNALRMEKGFMGASELTNEVTLIDVNEMRFADLNKDFVGKAATLVAMQEKPRWRCVYLQIEVDGISDGNGSEAVLKNDEHIGVITSIAYGYTVDKVLAFAFINPNYAIIGDTVEVLILNKKRKATIIDSSVYDPQSQKPRQP